MCQESGIIRLVMLTLPAVVETDRICSAGVRFHVGGVHTSRTLMSAELTELLRAIPIDAVAADYEHAIVNENVLGKSTISNRKKTHKRMGELFGLDLRVPLFVVLRRLWELDPVGRPRLALLCGLARDPILRATAAHILPMPMGTELVRTEYSASIREFVETRLNDGVLDQVARNSGASWTQSGHLDGRNRKIRQPVPASFGPVALALWLGSLEGRVADELLVSFWMRIFDAPRSSIIEAALRAKQNGLIYASIGAGIVQIDASPVFRPTQERTQ